MKRLSIFLAMMFVALVANAQKIEHVYHYSNPIVNTQNGYQQIGLQGCSPISNVGEPTLPWQNVSLMLPQNVEGASISVEFSDFVEMEGEYNLYPYQRPRPYSETREIPFEKNENIYRSSEVYPSRTSSDVNTQYLNGVGFAFSGFTPVRYVPATGKVSYAKTVKVTVECEGSRADHSRNLWLTPENQAAILRLAQNGSVLNTYEKRGRELNGYDMLIITSEEWIEPLAEYIQLQTSRGIRTQIVSLEEIYAQMEGRDEPEKIRYYIKQEYENNGISMVNLAGDVSIVPFRYLWCFAQEGYEDQLPADMYYVCLDGTQNDDNDDRWGEVGEDDLLPELNIARLPFNNQKQFETIMHKTFSYTLNPVLGEFTSPILGAEHLGDGYYGSDDMERLIGGSSDYDYTTVGYPVDYDFKKYYATNSVNWSGTDFKNVIRSGGQYVHHVGHANADYVAGWTGSMMPDNFFEGNDGVNHNYMIFHSHGCICGDFPHACVLEKMITIETGFVCTCGNSRYGWYSPWGDGMAAHIHRELVDAFCGDHMQFLCEAMREAKIQTAPYVTMYGEEGCFRWNIYCLNQLGDVALTPWFEEPFNPDVTYSNGLLIGTESTTVNVMQDGQPLNNFRVSLYHGEELLGFGLTDDEGNATMVFDRPIDAVGEMQLIVTGQSAWPQVLDVMGFEGSEPYVYADFKELDREPISEENCGLSITLHNISNTAANHIETTLSTDCDYITITNGTMSRDNVAAMSDTDIDNAFQFTIADDTPDYTRVVFEIACNDGNETHTTQRGFRIFAPNIAITEVEFDDSLGNDDGMIDAGEEIILHVKGINKGHAMASDVMLSALCQDCEIHIENASLVLGDVDINGTFATDITFTSDEDIVGGTAYTINFQLATGAYEIPYDYIFSVGYAHENFETGDLSYMGWDLGGDKPWFVTNEEAYEGEYSVRSGAIDDDEISSLILYANTSIDGDLSFHYKTSTASHDYLALLIDDEVIKIWDKENDWKLYSTEIKAGSHVIEFRYDKSPNGVGGQDCVWIDNVIFPPTFIVTDVEENVSEKTNGIYPNPNNGSFTISLAQEHSNIVIFNQLGQCVKHLENVSGYQTVELEDAQGLYFVQIQSGDQTETYKMLVK